MPALTGFDSRSAEEVQRGETLWVEKGQIAQLAEKLGPAKDGGRRGKAAAGAGTNVPVAGGGAAGSLPTRFGIT